MVCVKRIALILFLAGCPKEKSSVPDAAVAKLAAPAPKKGPLTLTPQMLEAYIVYQRTWVNEAQGERVDRSRREEAAQKASGLSELQLAEIDAMVSSVIARRMVTQLTDNPGFNPELTGMAQGMSAEQKKHLEEGLAAFKNQQQAAHDLKEERRQFGSQNIDVLLTKEAELTKLWQDMMGLGAYPDGVPTPARPDSGP